MSERSLRPEQGCPSVDWRVHYVPASIYICLRKSINKGLLYLSVLPKQVSLIADRISICRQATLSEVREARAQCQVHRIQLKQTCYRFSKVKMKFCTLFAIGRMDRLQQVVHLLIFKTSSSEEQPMHNSHSRTKKRLQLTSQIAPNDHSSITSSQQKLLRAHTHLNKDRWVSKDSDELQVTAFRQQYDAALLLIRSNDPSSQKAALTVLSSLCNKFKESPDRGNISCSLIENALKNYLALKSMISNQKVDQESELQFIRFFTSYFEERFKMNVKGESFGKQNLSLFFLIQANYEYNSKLYREALLSCQKSVGYCCGTKAQIEIHLMKVEFLKSSIFGFLKEEAKEAESVKECLKLINSLYSTISDLSTKEYVLSLKKILAEKQKTIVQLQPQLERKPSIHKFRTRSTSLKKNQSLKIITKQPQNTLRGHTPDRLFALPQKEPKKDSISITKSAQHSHHASVSLATINPALNSQKKKTLKKRALKIETNKFLSLKNEAAQLAIDQIQNENPAAFKVQELMVARPRPKKWQKNEETKNSPHQCQEFEEEPMALVLENKKSKEEASSSRIEPVTHFIRRSISNEMTMVDDDYEKIVLQCIQAEEENIIKGYIRVNYPQDITSKHTLQNNESELFLRSNLLLKSAEDVNSKESIDATPIYPENLSVQKKLHYTKVRQSILNSKEYQDIQDLQREIYSYSNNDFDIKQDLGVCTTFGYLTNFILKLKVLEHFQKDSEDEIKRVVLIQFEAILNQEKYIQVELKFPLTKIYESDIYTILEQLNRNLSIADQDIPEKITHRLFNLISNQIIPMRKLVGTAYVQKIQHQSKISTPLLQYKAYLNNRLINYELNNLTEEFFAKKVMTQTEQQMSSPIISLQKAYRQSKVAFVEEESEEGSDTYSNYIPQLMKKFTQDVRQDSSSVSSRRRMRTERMFKNTLFSYKSTMKSIDFAEFNLCVKDQDTKSLSLAIMPSEFQDKISKYFQDLKEGIQQIPFEHFYYCMKFVLIKPYNKYIDRFLRCFYDQIQVECLHCLQDRMKVKIRMTCYKVKEIFRADNEVFYKFELQYTKEKVKAMKFIATTKDLRSVERSSVSKSKRKVDNETNLRSSKRFQKQQKIIAINDEAETVQFNTNSMLALLRRFSSYIIVKKSYIYSAVGFENTNSYFNFINKFRLQGKTTQGKNFMISHLKQIEVLFQKSIKMHCDPFKWFTVLTIRHIQGSDQFSLIFYVPKLQRTYTVTLTRMIISYLNQQQVKTVFGTLITDAHQMQNILFTTFEGSLKEKQRACWNRLCALFEFQSRFMDDRIHILVRIGAYCGFLKDCSLSEYFQIDKKIYSMEMSLTKKANPLSSSIRQKRKHQNIKLAKRKSSSTKDIAQNKSEATDRAKIPKRKMLQVYEREGDQKEAQSRLFRRFELFDHFSQIYESDISKYVLYISLSELLEIPDFDLQEGKGRQAKKLTVSFELSDLINLIKKCKQELKALGLNSKVEFNQEVFSFALILRMMTVIKHRIIKELKFEYDKDQKFIEELFDGSKTIQNQKRFKNRLNQVFASANQNYYSLNISKRNSKLQSNIYVIHKNIMKLKKNQLVAFMLNEADKSITIFLSNNSSLECKHRTMKIGQMRFPMVAFLGKEELVRVNRRLHAYYRNVLLAE